jgi:hypothetical protein
MASIFENAYTINTRFVATMAIKEWDILFIINNMRMDFGLCDVYKVERR